MHMHRYLCTAHCVLVHVHCAKAYVLTTVFIGTGMALHHAYVPIDLLVSQVAAFCIRTASHAGGCNCIESCVPVVAFGTDYSR